jgi:argonaute-like protein implicated in RNA metabolism and viral defense
MLIVECKKVNPFLDHIVIHRDGFCRNSEQLFFKDFFEKAEIKYTIISILKKINRKIVIKIDDQDKYGSAISSYLNYDDNFSYIISTNVMGNKLSNPYKIQFIDSNYKPCYTLTNAVDDIYNLTYMCFHTTLKTRLPATIFYSDKSSTSHGRNYITNEKVYQKVFQP